MLSTPERWSELIVRTVIKGAVLMFAGGNKCFLRPTSAFENQFIFLKIPLQLLLRIQLLLLPQPSLLLDAPKQRPDLVPPLTRIEVKRLPSSRQSPLAGLRLGGPPLCRHYGHTIIIPVHIIHSAIKINIYTNVYMFTWPTG